MKAIYFFKIEIIENYYKKKKELLNMVIKNQEKIYIINLIIFYKYKDFPKKVFQEKDTTEKRLLSKNWVNDNLLIIKNIKILSFKNKHAFFDPLFVENKIH